MNGWVKASAVTRVKVGDQIVGADGARYTVLAIEVEGVHLFPTVFVEYVWALPDGRAGRERVSIGNFMSNLGVA